MADDTDEGVLLKAPSDLTRAPAPWLSTLLDALLSEKFFSAVDQFVHLHCALFLATRGEHRLEHTKVHDQYQRLFESRIEAHLRANNVSHQAFCEEIMAAHDDAAANAAVDQSEQPSLLRSLQVRRSPFKPLTRTPCGAVRRVRQAGADGCGEPLKNTSRHVRTPFPMLRTGDRGF